VAKLQRYTHFAPDAVQDLTGQFSEGFAREGEPPKLLLELELRGTTLVRVYRLHTTAGYELSPFERACELDERGDLEGARTAFAALAEPGRRTLCLGRARALVDLRRPDAARALLGLLAPDDPDRRRLEARL
jgi:hypothetical protein